MRFTKYVFVRWPLFGFRRPGPIVRSSRIVFYHLFDRRTAIRERKIEKTKDIFVISLRLLAGLHTDRPTVNRPNNNHNIQRRNIRNRIVLKKYDRSQRIYDMFVSQHAWPLAGVSPRAPRLERSAPCPRKFNKLGPRMRNASRASCSGADDGRRGRVAAAISYGVRALLFFGRKLARARSRSRGKKKK